MSNDNWGDVARIGIFIVGAEAVPEAEWWAMAPPGVSIHASRVSAPTPWAKWTPDGMDLDVAPDVERGCAQLAALAPSAVVIAHSSSSIAGGSGWDEAVVEKLATYLPSATKITTNSIDCVLALRARGVTRPFLVFPPWFGDAIISRGVDYFAEKGLPAAAHIRQIPEAKWREFRPEELYGALMHVEQRTDVLLDQIVAACPKDADGVLIAGTGVRCVRIIANLEAALGRPVVTANQASLWRCLSLAGVDSAITGYGALLQMPRDLTQGVP
ncbi:MAG: hypothetical protein AAFV19_20190 [Pseudomonadota bacterium]